MVPKAELEPDLGDKKTVLSGFTGGAQQAAVGDHLVKFIAALAVGVMFPAISQISQIMV